MTELKKNGIAGNIERIVRYLVMALSAYACINYIKIHDRISLASALLTIFLLFLPALVQRFIRLRLPVSVRLVYLLFIICAMYLGEIWSFFYRFLWWDDMLHTASAMMVCYIGLILVFVINKDREVERKLAPAYIALSIFCFTLAFGALWEVLEFTADQLFGVNMLKGRDSSVATSVYDGGRALINTMQDIALDALGAFIISLITFIHLKRGKLKESAFGILLRQMLDENPGLVHRNTILKH